MLLGLFLLMFHCFLQVLKILLVIQDVFNISENCLRRLHAFLQTYVFILTETSTYSWLSQPWGDRGHHHTLHVLVVRFLHKLFQSCRLSIKTRRWFALYLGWCWNPFGVKGAASATKAGSHASFSRRLDRKKLSIHWRGVASIVRIINNGLSIEFSLVLQILY